MSGREIIIFEDEPDLSQVLETVLSKAGYGVRCALDGRWAQDLCRKCLPDLVITDIYMPERDGLEVITALRKNFPSIKIIAMSGKSGLMDARALAQRLGAHLTFTKPFDVQELLHAVQTLLV